MTTNHDRQRTPASEPCRRGFRTASAGGWDQDAIPPNAQMDSLYPFVRKAADASCQELSFLQSQFKDVVSWSKSSVNPVRICIYTSIIEIGIGIE